MVLFSGGTQTACGPGMTQMGPFYCPLDQKVYVDLAFYDELKRHFNAPGDFAQAYVVAHEVGHHVQTLLGIAEKVQSMKQRMNERRGQPAPGPHGTAGRLSRRRVGQPQRSAQKPARAGRYRGGLNAASQIGDDMIQKQTQGRVVPDAFTHGTAGQRVRWFKQGFQSGEMQTCDTFGTDL